MTLTVSQITQAIKLSLESTFPNISIQGEVSNCRLQASGHLYFSLKDETAQISGVMFRGNASRLKKVPKDGDQVVMRGDLNVYPPSGRYQIVARELEFAGIGPLLLKLEALKKKLHEQGWFKKEHKKPLPKFPKTIGVVTSPTGAAIQDILNILTRRFSGFHLILNPVRVQGEEAAREIAEAIKQFDRHKLVDVMIVGRGGGSIEDLWAFNEEVVAEAIFHCETPIIAAIGHETDHCIAEYVADVRAPTPSAAAEIVMAEKRQTLDVLANIAEQLTVAVRYQLGHQRERLAGMLRQPVMLSPYPLLGPWFQKIDDARSQTDQCITQQLREKRLILEARQKLLMSLNPKGQISHFQQKLAYFDKALAAAVSRLIHLHQERLTSLVASLQSIDPKNLLKRGYTILFSEKERSLITSVNQLTSGDTVRTLLTDGEVVSTINKVEPR